MEDEFEETTFRKEERLDNLESRIGELSDKIEASGLLGIQAQIKSLSDRVKNLEDVDLETRRHVAFVDIETLRNVLQRWLAQNLDIKTLICKEAQDYIQRASAGAQQEILDSLSPITVARHFREKCQNYLDRHNLQAFFET